MNNLLRVHKIISKTESEGPGLRTAIWVQGCTLRCENCYEKETWDAFGGYDISIDDIIRIASDTEGVTVLGGEPSEQAKGVSILLKKLKSIGKNCIVFSGYTLEELKGKKTDAIKMMLDHTDLLIDGRFDYTMKEEERPLIGSKNQRIVPLSDVGNILLERLKEYKNKVEIRITVDGLVTINGMWKEEN